MRKIKTIATRLQKWNHIFCTGMTCKTNLKRDVIIISAMIILSGVLIGTNYHIYNKKIQAAKAAASQVAKIENKAPEQVAVAEQKPTEQVVAFQNSNSTPVPVKINKPVAKTVAMPPKKVVTKTKSTGISCIKIPPRILVKLKGAPTPPDGKMKNGKLICHVLAEGKKDNPHKSSKNSKGEWGGCCYDPDEIPNPNCCYPVGSVYEKPLNKYFNNPFPHRK